MATNAQTYFYVSSQIDYISGCNGDNPDESQLFAAFSIFERYQLEYVHVYEHCR